MKFIKQNWVAIITILFMILVGILLLVNPATFAIGIIKVAGVVLFLWGIYDLIRYFRTPADTAARGSAFFSGITMITLGAYCLFGSDWFVTVFPVLAVLYGLFQVLIGFRKLQRMVDALRLGRPLWWLRAISAGITLLFGFLIAFNPTMTMMSVWVFTGITLIIEGIFDAVLLYATYKKRLAEDPMQSRDYAHIEV